VTCPATSTWTVSSLSVEPERYREAEAALWASVGLTPSEHPVQLAATGTQVRVQGVGTGMPVLFIHGGTNAGSTWAGMLPHLEGLRCLLVDRPGTGLSDPLPHHRREPARIGARFVSDILDGLGIDRAHVVASSFGGHLALRCAAATPERFRRMVQMGCPALAPGETLPPLMRLLTEDGCAGIVNALPPTSGRSARSCARSVTGRASTPGGSPGLLRLVPRAPAPHRHDAQRRCHDRQRRTAAGHDRPHRGELLGAVTVPTLFWWGADDTFGDADVARRVAAPSSTPRSPWSPRGPPTVARRPERCRGRDDGVSRVEVGSR
jgi:2-hydroxy-6-oxonona-2,4-dienedioate hydrolase